MAVLWFLAFLASFIALMWFGTWINNRITREFVHGRWLWTTLLQGLTGVGFFLLSIWLLSGFFNLTLALVLVGSLILSIVVTMGVWAFLREINTEEWALREQTNWRASLRELWSGSGKEKWGIELFWGYFELGATKPLLGCLPALVGLILLVAYPTVMGIVFFTHERGQPELILLVIRYSVVYTVVVWCVSQASTFAVLLDPTLESEGRTRQTVTLGSSMIQLALYVALGIWSFSPTTTDPTDPTQGALTAEFARQASPVLAATIFVFFGLTVLLPYFLGGYRARRFRAQLLQERVDKYNSLINILDVPTAEEYMPRLAELGARLDEQIEKLSAEWETRNPANMDARRVGPLFDLLQATYAEYTECDPRAKYIAWLIDFREQLKETIATLESKQGAEIEVNAARWAVAYARRRERLEEKMTELRGAKSIAWATGSAVLWLVISAFLGEVARFAWMQTYDQVKQASLLAPNKPGENQNAPAP